MNAAVSEEYIPPKSSVTVAIYQGDDAENVCLLRASSNTVPSNLPGMAGRTCKIYGSSASFAFCRDIQVAEATPSHPNIIQVYGTMSSGNMHATIFHDGALYNLQ